MNHLEVEEVPYAQATGAYEIRVYVAHGYYAYCVQDMGRALAHAHTIMSSRVYRRYSDGSVEFHHVEKVVVVGEGLQSVYRDEFKRT